MPNARVVMVSALMLAMAVATLRPPQGLSVRFTLSGVDWREAKAALTCPLDLPPDCAILWGP